MGLGWLIAGPLGGFLAGWALKGDKEFQQMDIVIGLLGGLVGGILFDFMADGLLGKTVAAFLGAVILTWGYERYTGRALQ